MTKKITAVCTVVLLLSVNGCGEKEISAVLPDEGSCSVDGPRPGTQLDRAKEVSVWGWAFDPQLAKVPESLLIELVSEDGKTIIPAVGKRDVPRPDVAKHFSNPVLERSGFSAKLNIATAPPGIYRFVVVQNAERRLLVCLTKTKISID